MKSFWLRCIPILYFSIFLSCSETKKETPVPTPEPTPTPVPTPVIPTGIVLMTQEATLQNGTTLALEFRVNPSNYPISLDKLQLDVPQQNITKGSFITTADEYTLTGIEPYKNSAGEVCEGAYVARIEISDGAYYSDARLMLVLSYTDANGDPALLTSSTATTLKTRVKLTPERLKINVPNAASYLLFNNQTPHVPMVIDPAAIASGSSTLFNMDDVEYLGAKSVGVYQGMFELTQTDARHWILSPNSSFAFPNDATRSLPATVQFSFRDKNSQQTIIKESSVNFFRNEASAPVQTWKISELANGSTLEIDLGETLATLGVSSSLFSATDYPPLAPTLTRRFLNASKQTTSTWCTSAIQYRDNKSFTAPESMYLQLHFFATPSASGNYFFELKFLYSLAGTEGAVGLNIVAATLWIPITVVP